MDIETPYKIVNSLFTITNQDNKSTKSSTCCLLLLIRIVSWRLEIGNNELTILWGSWLSKTIQLIHCVRWTMNTLCEMNGVDFLKPFNEYILWDEICIAATTSNWKWTIYPVSALIDFPWIVKSQTSLFKGNRPSREPGYSSHHIASGTRGASRCAAPFSTLYEKTFNLKLRGYQVYYTAWSWLAEICVVNFTAIKF